MTAQRAEPGAAVAPMGETPKIALIQQRLRRMENHFADVLPKHLTPDRMVKMTLLAINRQPALLECTAESIAEAVMQISSWGLEIGRTAHLVAFGKQCTAIADYKGKIELAIRGGSVTTCRARVVHEHDSFEVEYGLTERLVHRPTWREEPGKPVGAYAVVVLPNGETKFDLMSTADIERIRGRSRAKEKGPWVTDWAEMAKKTVVHRLLKMVPQNPLLASAFEADLEDREETAQEIRAAMTSRPVRDGGYDEPRPALPVAATFAQANEAAAEAMRGATEDQRLDQELAAADQGAGS